VTIGTPLVLVSGTSASNQISRTSATFTPTAGIELIVACAARENTGGAPAPDLTISNSGPGTFNWNEITVSNAASNRHTASVWGALTPGNAGTLALTFTASENCNRWEWIIFEVSGCADAIDTNSVTGLDTTTTPSATLPSAPALTSVVIGVLASVADTDGVAPGSGFTELYDTSPGTSTTLETEYKTNTTSTTVDWSGADPTSNLYIAFELTAESQEMAPSIITPRRRRR
jgi:hypothetical protein